MTIDGDILEIDIDMALDGVKELHNFVKDRLEYIEEIVLLGDKEEWKTSSLFTLLAAIKKKKPTITISSIDDGSFNMECFGMFHWKR